MNESDEVIALRQAAIRAMRDEMMPDHPEFLPLSTREQALADANAALQCERDQPTHADIFREVVRLERALWASAAVVEAARAWARTAPIGSMTTRETELFAAVHALPPTETTTSDRRAE